MLSIPPHKERKPCFNTLLKRDNLGKFWHIRLGDRWWRCYADSLRLEPTDQKVYLLNEFWEGWGGYKLYYFDLKGKNPHKLIEAKSYYHKDKQGGTDDDPIFMAKLTHLQQRLNPLPPIAPKSAINIIINKHTTQNVPMPYDPERIITQYHHQYHLSHGKYQSPPQQATTYHRPNLTITQAHQIPKHNKMLCCRVSR